MRGGMRGSAGLVWRHQRLLWWLFAMNLLPAWISSLPLRAELSKLLDHSLASQQLVTGFHLGTFFLLLQQPQLQVRALEPGAMAAAAVFFLVTIFFDGGLLHEYLEERTTGVEEFASLGLAFFWRMLRLAFYAAVVMGALLAAGAAASHYAVKLTDTLPDARFGFAAATLVRLLTLLAALLARQWFDVAQARVVRGDGRKMLRELGRSFRPALRSGLYPQYLGISVLAAASLAAGLWLWVQLPHAAVVTSFLLLELVTLAQIGARLWMKAASARWVAAQPEAAPWCTAEAAIEATIDAAAITAETAPEPPPV